MLAKIHPDDPQCARHSAIDDKLSKVSATSLTVWKKSLVYRCNGFTVFNSSGNLEFRVDNYPSDPKDEILLMDAAGMALFTMRRKRLSLQNEWQGFLGEFRDGRKPLFVVRRAPSLLTFSKCFAEVYVRSSAKSKKNDKRHFDKRRFDYRVAGCYAKRSFTILNRFNEVVAEVKPKQVRSDITLGGDVFNLTVLPGYDQASVMGLIIVLDQIMPSTQHPSIPTATKWKGEKGISFRFPKSFGIGIAKFCQTRNEDVESRCLVLRNNYRIAFSAGP